MSYEPNFIPLKKRALNIVVSIVLLAYGGYGVYINDLFIPGKRSSGIHLHDNPAFMMYISFICAALVMISVIIDHYDKRDNEAKYKWFARVFEHVGGILFILAFIWQIIINT